MAFLFLSFENLNLEKLNFTFYSFKINDIKTNRVVYHSKMKEWQKSCFQGIWAAI